MPAPSKPSSTPKGRKWRPSLTRRSKQPREGGGNTPGAGPTSPLGLVHLDDGDPEHCRSTTDGQVWRATKRPRPEARDGRPPTTQGGERTDPQQAAPPQEVGARAGMHAVSARTPAPPDTAKRQGAGARDRAGFRSPQPPRTARTGGEGAEEPRGQSEKSGPVRHERPSLAWRGLGPARESTTAPHRSAGRDRAGEAGKTGQASAARRALSPAPPGGLFPFRTPPPPPLGVGVRRGKHDSGRWEQPPRRIETCGPTRRSTGAGVVPAARGAQARRSPAGGAPRNRPHAPSCEQRKSVSAPTW